MIQLKDYWMGRDVSYAAELLPEYQVNAAEWVRRYNVLAEQGKKIDELSGTINEWLTRLDASFKTMRTLVWVVGLIVSGIVLIANYPSEVITILRAVAKEP